MTSPLPPVVCNLTEAGAVSQALEWADLQRHTLVLASISGGVRMHFPLALERQLADLTARESACCSFLDIVTARIGGEIVIDVSSVNPDALPVIERLSGIRTGD